MDSNTLELQNQFEREETGAPPVTPRPLRQHRSRRNRRRIVLTRWALPFILIAQTGLSLRLVWANTAFSDESLYLWAGHLEWTHWLHGSTIPAFSTYFSGAPVIYPPLGALADSLGGLAGARILSLVFMLGATSLLYLTTRHLFGRREALCGTAIFAALGPVQVLGSFATFDAMAVFLIALGTWLAVRASAKSSELLLVACGLTLGLADATKYASTLWTPVVIALVALASPQRGVLRATFRALRVTVYVAAPITVALFEFGGREYVKGVLFTTLSREADSTYASASTVLLDSFNWVGIVFLLAALGTVVALYTSSRVRWVCVLFTAAIVLAPLHQAQIHTTTSLHKHVVFGAWFGCIVAGYLLAKAGEVNPLHGWRVGAVAAGLALFIGVPQATQMFVYGWPNTSAMNADLARIIPASGCPCLIAEQSQLRYYLPQIAERTNIVGPYTFWFWSRDLHKEMHGPIAYEEAIKEDYFSVVEIDPAENVSIYKPVIEALDSTAGYRLEASVGYHLEASIPIDHWGNRTMQIWRYVSRHK